MTRYFAFLIAILALLPACDASSRDPAPPALPQFGIAAEHAIRLEEWGQSTEEFKAADPAQQPVVLASCEPTALEYVVQVG